MVGVWSIIILSIILMNRDSRTCHHPLSREEVTVNVRRRVIGLTNTKMELITRIRTIILGLP